MMQKKQHRPQRLLWWTTVAFQGSSVTTCRRTGDGKTDCNTRFLRVREVLEMTGMSRSFIYAQMAEGTFPKQIHWVLAPSSGTNVRWSSGWKTAWHPDDPDGWGDLNTNRTSKSTGRALRRCSAFFVPEIVCGAKSFTAYPFVRSRRALPQSSAVLYRLLVVVGKVVGNFRQYCLKLSSTV